MALSYDKGGIGVGYTANASGARGHADGTDVTQTNTAITAGRAASLSSGGDTNLNGAVVNGSSVKVDIGGEPPLQGAPGKPISRLDCRGPRRSREHINTTNPYNLKDSMIKTILAALTATAALAGCAALGAQFRAASEPQGGDRARVRIIAAQQVRATPGKACGDAFAPGNGVVIGAALGSSGYAGRALGMPAGQPVPPSGSVAEMYVAADQPITFSFVFTPGDPYRCSVSGISFVPQANTDYEVVMSHDTARGLCGVSTRSLTDPQARVSQSVVSRCGAQR